MRETGEPGWSGVASSRRARSREQGGGVSELRLLETWRGAQDMCHWTGKMPVADVGVEFERLATLGDGGPK